MNYRNMIENKLLELEGGRFQKLCNEFLDNLNIGLVTDSGGQTGTDKTVVGTPDSYILLENGKFIFIEYTTQQSGVCKKFLDDIIKCLDESKTGVPISKIEKIIIMYNSKISAGDLEVLFNTCERQSVKFEKYDINNISHLLASKLPFLTKSYLGLSIDKGQFLDYKTFINLNDQSMLSTPLGILTHGRKDSIREFQRMIDENYLLIVTGKTGIGKTKFVCEVLKQYVHSDNRSKVWFIKDRGFGLYEELHKYTAIGQHIVFLDDINKLTAIDELFTYLSENKDRIKIVATVREYALTSIIERGSKYANPKVYEMEVLKDDVIINIIKENFDIYNSEYQNQIVKLAKGNVRLAVMMAILAKSENTLESISSIGNIIEKYYEFMKKKLDGIDDINKLKALGALSFIEKLHLDSDESMEIVSRVTGLTADELNQCYSDLHYDEMVDLYEDEVVVMSDQIISVFIFHYVYEVRGFLDYFIVLESLFPKHKNRIVQNVNDVVSYYGNIDFFSNVVKRLLDIWRDGNKSSYRELLFTFWFVKPEETLLHISNEIKCKMDNKDIIEKYKVDKNIEVDYMLDILGHFSNDENYESAIEIVLDYLEKDYSEIGSISKMLIDYYGYNNHSNMLGYQLQKTLVGKVIDRIGNGKEIFVQLFCNISAHLLSYFIEWTETKDSNSIIFHRIPIYNVGEMKEIRTQIWSTCNLLLLDSKFRSYALNLLEDYGDDRGSTEDATLYELDYALINDNIIDSINVDDFMECSVLYKMNNQMKFNLKKKFPVIENPEKYRLQIYKMFNELPYDYDDDYDIGEGILKKNHITFAKDMKVENYKDFLETCKEIDAVNENKYNSSEVLYRVIMNVNNFVEFTKLYIELNTPFDTQPSQIVRLLIDEIGYKESYDLICKYEFDKKEYWLYLIFSCAEKVDLTEAFYLELIEYFEANETVSTGYYRSLDFLENYKQYDEDIFCLVVRTIFEKSDELLKKIYLDRLFIEKSNVKNLILKFVNDKELLIDIYLYVFEMNEIYDPNGIVCRFFLELDESLIFRIIDILCNKNNRHLRDYESYFDYTLFWDRKSEKILELADYIINKYKDSLFDNYLEQFFINNRSEQFKEKINSVITLLISKYYDDEKVIRNIFYIVAYYDDETRISHYLSFINYNDDIKSFERLPFSKQMESWSGSEVPRIIVKKKFFGKFLNQLTGVKYLGHRGYIKSIIERYDDSIKKVRIQEFLQGY